MSVARVICRSNKKLVYVLESMDKGYMPAYKAEIVCPQHFTMRCCVRKRIFLEQLNHSRMLSSV
jgi:hypothetical protein